MIGRPKDHSSKLARGELSDPEAAERFEAEHPEAFMRRRDFLARTAALAGAASLATVLPADTLVAEAASRGLRPCPAPRNMPINTFVVLMMENRSFDHYFGWYPNADGKNAGLSYPDANGNQVATHHLTSDFQGCDFRDPDHSWDGGRFQYHKGKMDGFVKGNAAGTGSDAFAAGYYLKQRPAVHPLRGSGLHALRPLVLLDHGLHLPQPPLPVGRPGRRHEGQRAPAGTGFTSGRRSSTGQGPRPHGPLLLLRPAVRGALRQRGRRGHTGASSTTTRRPASCPTSPSSTPRSVRRGPGHLRRRASARRHPRSARPSCPTSSTPSCESPQYRRGALFIDYDEWGGFFEHVEPPLRPRRSRQPGHRQDWGMTGFRIPGVCVSPFTRRAASTT